ncbi:amidohydrolase, partial [Acinetobacter baumannii]
SQAAPNHNPSFIVDDKALKTGPELHIRFVLDYPNIAKQVQAAWNQS